VGVGCVFDALDGEAELSLDPELEGADVVGDLD
jgi:hypothetical protein